MSKVGYKGMITITMIEMITITMIVMIAITIIEIIAIITSVWDKPRREIFHR